MSLTAADFGKVAVLMGGESAEREVSLKSGRAVFDSLLRQGIDAQGIDFRCGMLTELAHGNFDRVFIVLHGRMGEDGVLQGALALLGLPYTGSGVLASALGMDKWRSKAIWRANGLPVPASVLLSADSDFAAVEAELGLPLFVKPANEGSSVGVTMVAARGGVKAAYEVAAAHDAMVLAEQFMDGGEYTVTILNGKALPAIRIVPARAFYDYEAKYLRDDTQYLSPCGLDAEAEARMQSLALQAFDRIGCRGWGRVDFLLDAAGAPHVLEVNTVPGMTDHSLVPMAARAVGWDFDRLVWEILAGTLEQSHD